MMSYRPSKELGTGDIGFGYLTMTVTVMGNNTAQATERAKRVQEVIDAQGFSSTIETVNSLDAWLGAFPGRCMRMYARRL